MASAAGTLRSSPPGVNRILHCSNHLLAPQHEARYGPCVAAPIVIKKYGNRRLYDTDESRYVTLDELAAKIRAGAELRVVDAQTGEELTQGTLTQIVLETGHAARFLPVQLLTQMIRLSDDALAEFFSRYVTGALELYLQAKRGGQTIAAYHPLAQLPVAASDALARMWMSSPFGYGPGAPPPYAPEPTSTNGARDVAAMRRELDELKQLIRGGARPAAPARERPAAPARERPPARKKRRS
jgi:polyhydroxyalkanoate synthesis repressor PhaR